MYIIGIYIYIYPIMCPSHMYLQESLTKDVEDLRRKLDEANNKLQTSEEKVRTFLLFGHHVNLTFTLPSHSNRMPCATMETQSLP